MLSHVSHSNFGQTSWIMSAASETTSLLVDAGAGMLVGNPK